MLIHKSIAFPQTISVSKELLVSFHESPTLDEALYHIFTKPPACDYMGYLAINVFDNRLKVGRIYLGEGKEKLRQGYGQSIFLSLKQLAGDLHKSILTVMVTRNYGLIHMVHSKISEKTRIFPLPITADGGFSFEDFNIRDYLPLTVKESWQPEPGVVFESLEQEVTDYKHNRWHILPSPHQPAYLNVYKNNTLVPEAILYLNTSFNLEMPVR